MSFIEANSVNRVFRVIEKKKGFARALKNLVRPSYKVIRAVNDVSFSIEKGEAVGFIGPNGAGKSTTVKMLTGILVPTSGTICVDGMVPHKNRKKYVANIGVVFGQRTQLWWDLPVCDTFDLLRHVYRVNDKMYKENMELFNDILGLDAFINQPVRQLSLGQRMRAEIAAALLHNPSCLFLDEPTIGLDVVAKEKIREFIKTLNREKKTTILFTTHDLQDIEKICEKIIIIDHGKLIYNDSIGKIKKEYEKERVVEIDFNRKYDGFALDGIKIEKKTDFKKILYVDISTHKVSDVIRDITNNYDVSDLTIKEPEIEAIIREIYENGMQP